LCVGLGEEVVATGEPVVVTGVGEEEEVVLAGVDPVVVEAKPVVVEPAIPVVVDIPDVLVIPPLVVLVVGVPVAVTAVVVPVEPVVVEAAAPEVVDVNPGDAGHPKSTVGISGTAGPLEKPPPPTGAQMVGSKPRILMAAVLNGEPGQA